MAIERRKRLEDGSFGPVEKLGLGVTQTEKVAHIEADVETVAEVVILNGGDIAATADTVAFLTDLVIGLSAQVEALQTQIDGGAA